MFVKKKKNMDKSLKELKLERLNPISNPLFSDHTKN